ncbi:MAG: Crp/Fnr family transcriptional regulator [Lachnospiraceae bacterium]|nr:Crp/Fnr family transcriptional regulator [Lachnospiraceae bacterium]
MTLTTKQQLNNVKRILKDCELFTTLSPLALNTCIMAGEFIRIEKDQAIDLESRGLFVVISGLLYAKSNNATLNVFKKGCLTGVSEMFPDGKSTNASKIRVVAAKPSSVLFIEERKVEELIRELPDFSMNYIRFLTNRIRFLSGKLSYYTAPSAKETFANFLYENSLEDNSYINVNMAKLASHLNMGRATLYRALTSLEEEGLIEKKGNNILVYSRKKLLAISSKTHGKEI